MDWGDGLEWGGSAIQAYLAGNYKPIVKKGAKEAINYGVKNSGWDWALSGSGFTPTGQALSGGLGTLAAGLITGDTDGLAGKAATAAAGGYVGNAAARAALASTGQQAATPALGGLVGIGGSPALTGAMGAGIGGIASGMYEGFTTGNLSTGTQWGTVGGMVGSIFGPIGSFVGGMVGSMAASMLGADKPKVDTYVTYEGGSPMTFDEKTGKYVPSKIVDAFVTVNNKQQPLNPNQTKGLIAKSQQKLLDNVNKVNSLMDRMLVDDGTGAYTDDAMARRDAIKKIFEGAGQGEGFVKEFNPLHNLFGFRRFGGERSYDLDAEKKKIADSEVKVQAPGTMTELPVMKSSSTMPTVQGEGQAPAGSNPIPNTQQPEQAQTLPYQVPSGTQPFSMQQYASSQVQPEQQAQSPQGQGLLFGLPGMQNYNDTSTMTT